MFSDRKQAGSFLAEHIIEFLNAHNEINKNEIIVLALPRGGVTVALPVALTIGCALDVIVSKKIAAPDQPELAIGAVTSNGVIVVDHVLQEYLKISDAYLQDQVKQLLLKTKEAESGWRQTAGLNVPLNVEHRCAILIDDGVATGMTAIAALRSLRQQHAAQLIFATTVISEKTVEQLRRECDQVIGLEIPLDLSSVGQFYLDFQQTEDDEVIEAIKLANRKNKSTRDYRAH